VACEDLSHTLEPILSPLSPRQTATPLVADARHASAIARPLLDIFVVDDDLDSRCGVVRVLRHHGARVTVFDRAEPALLLARSGPPHLIVIDLDLPGMTGFEAADALKEEGATEDVPLLVLSRRGDSRTRTAAFAVGADVFLAKPCVTDELLAATWSLARRGRAVQDRRALSSMLRDALVSSRRLETLRRHSVPSTPSSN
jgi:DNA-binding response OmpR family regulator